MLDCNVINRLAIHDGQVYLKLQVTYCGTVGTGQ
jgi:hypothetical protein